MARTLYPRHDAQNWSSSVWGTTDTNDGTLVKPDTTDTVIFTADSGNITIDETTAYTVLMDFTGYTGTITISAAFILGSKAFIWSSGMTVAIGGGQVRVRHPLANDFWTGNPTFTVSTGYVYLNIFTLDRTNANDINTGTAKLRATAWGGSFEATGSAVITCGDLSIFSENNGQDIAFSAKVIASGDMTLGNVSTDLTALVTLKDGSTIAGGISNADTTTDHTLATLGTVAVVGDIDLTGIAYSPAAASITSAAAINVLADGVFSPAGNCTINNAAVTVNGGTFTDGGFELTLGGTTPSYVYTSGTASGRPYIKFISSGTCTDDSEAHRIGTLEISGVGTSIATAGPTFLRVAKVIGDGSFADDNTVDLLLYATANDFYQLSGECGLGQLSIHVTGGANLSNGAAYNFDCLYLWQCQSTLGNPVITINGDVICNTDCNVGAIAGGIGDEFCKVIFNGSVLVKTAGSEPSLSFAHGAGAYQAFSGQVTLGGDNYKFSAISKRTGNVGTQHAFALGNASVYLSGIFDGTSIPITSVGANLHGGTIQNVAGTDPLHCWGVTSGGSNGLGVLHEGSNAGVALGGMQSIMGVAV